MAEPGRVAYQVMWNRLISVVGQAGAGQDSVFNVCP